jgi:small subunit ribosomal protein S2
VAEGLVSRSGAQAGDGASTGAAEPMPDWERELLGASQEPAPAEPAAAVADDAAPVPAVEQPEGATEQAEFQADNQVDVERQTDQPVAN